jgi:PAS domain S-box-containing protein
MSNIHKDNPIVNSDSMDITRLKALVNHIPAAGYRCRADEFFTLEFFSDEIIKITGYPMDYFMDNRKDGYSKLVHAEDWELFKQACERAIANKEKYEIQYRIKTKDRTIRWVVESGKGVYDSTDEISYLDGCIFDITDRKNAEAALAKSEDEVKRLALVAHKTTNSVMITDENGYITWINEGYTRISGYTMDDLRGKKIGYSLDGPEADEKIVGEIRYALENKLPYKAELMSFNKNGEPIWLEVDCHPLQDEKGNHLGFMSIENDITQRKRTQTEQEELLQRLTLATDSAEIGIFEIDLSTNAVIWDERMYEIYGYPKNTTLNLYKIYNMAMHPDDTEMMAKIISELLSQKKEINGAVYRIILPDRRVRYIESHAIIKKSESGRIISLIGTNRDITEDVLVQEKIKMQNKALRDIAFIQSHEVRKPLANILGMIEILHNSGAFNDLELFNHLVESAKELDLQIRTIVSKTNELDDELFR